ncbi:MAG: hypothetical protein GWN86_06865 [Desulfobacterales bacterium]|nr:hypothetical protein [Desulfobacterales bacterium]
MSEIFVGLDLGQSSDYTALVAVEMVEQEEADRPLYHLRHLQRFDLGTPYTTIVSQVDRLFTNLAFDKKWLVVDTTGVGAPVVDLLKQVELTPIPVLITGGTTVNHEDGTFRVPKRDLVGILQSLFQTGRLKIAQGLPEVQKFVDELLDFQVKISTATGRDTYGAWREGTHDDMVLAAAIACWFGNYARERKRSPFENDFFARHERQSDSFWKW